MLVGKIAPYSGSSNVFYSDQQEILLNFCAKYLLTIFRVYCNPLGYLYVKSLTKVTL